MLWEALLAFTLGMAKRKAASLAPGHAAQLLTDIDQIPRTADDVHVQEIASLWSGLGAVYLLDDDVVMKHIRFPKGRSFSEQRDIDSYLCEAVFYARHAPRLLAPPVTLAIPTPLLVRTDDEGVTLCMSRLRGKSVGSDDFMDREMARAALDALASLHAAFWGVEPSELDGLQAQGSFWHLDTRAIELSAMPRKGWEGRLRLAARALDERLKADPMQTCVHGDCKDANFLFLPFGSGGAGKRRRTAVRAQLFDFQYIGRAPPSKDLAYLFTCVEGTQAERVEDELLRHYHQALSAALALRGIRPPRLEAVKESLQLAYADLARWMSGWEGGWWAKALLSQRTRALLDKLDGGEPLADEQAYREALFNLFPPSQLSDSVEPPPPPDGTIAQPPAAH
ncbi:kinase-like domain-containing protein [Pavlovales sp. CCMP2436]|nr:kinase-like domain-containing protein [Pavlovales sp. CCMP2436]